MAVTRKFLALLAAYSFLLSFVLASSAWAYIHTAATCSYANVSAAVATASSGDTVIVPSGNCTWSSALTITKGIILQGAGVGSTVITANTGGTYLVTYEPSNPSLNETFRLTGFEFNLQSATPGWHLRNSTTYPLTKVRLDNNKWTNCSYSNPFQVEGAVWGVIDSNTFSGYPHIDNYGYEQSDGQFMWQNFTFSFGSINNMYYEGNTFNTADTIFSGGAAGRYVFRYNTVNTTAGLWPMLDAHGNMGSGDRYATMGVEVYGNLSSGGDSRVLDHRGGMALAFYNYVTGGGMDLQVREEHCDSLNPPATASDGEPQHVSSSYYWNNRDAASGLVYFNLYENLCGTYHIAPNVDYWDFKTSFNGTQGTGCGTLASRPATCTTGVGYWATTQSCSTVPSASIGVNPTTPLSGTLYKCTSTNTWTAYYTPYTYPHPLRQAGGDTYSPSAPKNLMIISAP